MFKFQVCKEILRNKLLPYFNCFSIYTEFESQDYQENVIQFRERPIKIVYRHHRCIKKFKLLFTTTG